MITIEVFTRSVYGAINVYPANKAAEQLAQVAGTKTLSHKALTLAEAMGMQVKQVADPAMPKIGVAA